MTEYSNPSNDAPAIDRNEANVTRRPTKPPRKTIEERFREFDQKNPHIYIKLREFALQMRQGAKGRSRYSMKALWERIRWHYQFEVETGEEFALNNDFTALFARKLMDEEPELNGFFETRKRRAL